MGDIDCSPNQETIREPRRSTRPRRSTAKALDFEEFKRGNARKSRGNRSQDEESECKYSSEEEYETVQITDTVLSNTALAGKEIYGFTKVKKHERLISTPQQTVPKTPHRLREQMNKGIKSTLKNLSSDEEDAFIDSGSEYSGESEDDDDDDDEEEEEAEDEEEEESNNDGRLRSTRKPLNRKMKTANKSKQQKPRNYVIRTEEYFHHSGNKVTTSNHTLDKLQTPRLSQDQLQKLLSQLTLSKSHQKAVFASAEMTKEHFPKWLCLLHENFNILLYGLGTKKNVLNEFHAEMLSDSPVLVVNGFFPSLTLKDILDAIVNDLLGLDENTGNVYDALDTIAKEMQSHDQHLYLIVHNIEGDMLRNNKSQNVLSHLGAIRNVHLIASIDHINAPLIWDHNKLSKFNFIWYDVTSFLPYTDETSFESSMMVQRTGNLALSSLRNVFLSLTSNSKGIYTILLKYQLENNTSQYYQGLLFKDLYTACREAFLVSSDLALRAQLTEFVDHKMVKLKRSADGAEYLVIPIANNLLQQFLSEQK